MVGIANRTKLCVVALTLAGAWLCGCSKDKEVSEGGASSSAAAAPQKDPDKEQKVKDVCVKLCDKTVECAKALAGDEGDQAEAAKDAKQGLADCKKRCDTTEVTASDTAQVDQIEKCLDKGCEQFVACIARAGSPE